MTTKTTTVAAVTAGGVLAVGVAGVAMAAPVSPQSLLSPEGLGTPAKQHRPLDPGNLRDGKEIPVRDYYVSAGWGHSSGPHAGREHAGIDFASPMGEPLYAATEGKVIHAGNAGGYGNMVQIKTKSGKTLIYGHMKKVGVERGEKVRPGERIGKVGSTGYSTGPHLHFEVRTKKDRPTNPNEWLGMGKKGLNKLERELAKYDRKFR